MAFLQYLQDDQQLQSRLGSYTVSLTTKGGKQTVNFIGSFSQEFYLLDITPSLPKEGGECLRGILNHRERIEAQEAFYVCESNC